MYQMAEKSVKRPLAPPYAVIKSRLHKDEGCGSFGVCISPEARDVGSIPSGFTPMAITVGRYIEPTAEVGQFC